MPAAGLAAQQLCVCSVRSKGGVLGLPLPWSSLTGVQGCLVDFVLREVFLQDRVLEGSGTVVSLLSNFIPVSSCSWSPLEQLILLLAALEFWHISN